METNINTVADRRFGISLNKLLIEKKKTYLVMIGGALGLSIIFGLWAGLLGGAPDMGRFVIFTTFAGLGCAIAASLMFSDLSTKEGRVGMLMNPASACDKYLPRLIVYVPGMIALSVICYFAFVYSDILAIGARFDIWVNPYNPFANWTPNDTKKLCLFISFLLLNESIFTFGSVAWPKRSFLKTLCLLAALQVVLGFAFWGCFKLLKTLGVWIQVYDEVLLFWWIVSIITVIAVAIFYCAYLRLRKTTIA